MSMMNSIKVLSWLKHCTETRFYIERCEQHAKKYKTIYCRSCMGLACEICWKNSTEHRDHEFLQVYIASWRTSVELGDLSQFWDASNIQVYRINFKKVVYLNPNEKGRVEKNDRNPKCGSCSRKLIDSEYRFCSVSCKMRSTVSYRVRRRKARFPRRAAV